jgi:hypothetical protein
MVTLPPEAVSVPDRMPEVPTRTLPKASEVGFRASDTDEAVPVPVKETVGLVEALLTNVICPEKLPVDAGANFAV